MSTRTSSTTFESGMVRLPSTQASQENGEAVWSSDPRGSHEDQPHSQQGPRETSQSQYRGIIYSVGHVGKLNK